MMPVPERTERRMDRMVHLSHFESVWKGSGGEGRVDHVSDCWGDDGCGRVVGIGSSGHIDRCLKSLDASLSVREVKCGGGGGRLRACSRMAAC